MSVARVYMSVFLGAGDGGAQEKYLHRGQSQLCYAAGCSPVSLLLTEVRSLNTGPIFQTVVTVSHTENGVQIVKIS